MSGEHHTFNSFKVNDILHVENSTRILNLGSDKKFVTPDRVEPP